MLISRLDNLNSFLCKHICAKRNIKKRNKEKLREDCVRGNISNTCCSSPQDICCDTNNNSNQQIASNIGYKKTDLQTIPQGSILGLGCGAPLTFADLKTTETLVDLGSGAGIDAFLASKLVGNEGKVIGIDMTDNMLEKARNAAIKNNYNNVEYRKGDIEEKIPIEDNSVDVVISNCVINLTSNKTNAFKEVYRILKKEREE